MTITKAKVNDINSLLDILEEQRNYLKVNNIPQWQGLYPNKDTFLDDINKDRLYVIKIESNIIGFFALVYPDPNYEYIKDGSWMNDEEYISIHRMAIKEEYKHKGYATEVFNYVKDRFNHIRIDTHSLNIAMNKCLKKNNFEYRGIIFVEDKTPRNAYEWFK